MTRRNLMYQPFFLLLLVLLIALVSSSCGVCLKGVEAACEFYKGVPFSVVTSDRHEVLKTDGTLITYHGVGCAEGKKRILKVEESLELPSYATKATIVLNGWRAYYLGDDHHIDSLFTNIGNIRLEGNTLKWEAAGTLMDDEHNAGYGWCYYYTVVGWNPSQLDLTVDHEAAMCDMPDVMQSNSFGATNANTTTALSSFPSFLYNPDFTSEKNVAVMPRGFGFTRGCNSDHHLLQVGYNLVQTERIIQSDKKYWKNTEQLTPTLPNNNTRIGSGFVTWETSAIFKDNDTRREYDFAETVSGLAGKDVGLIQPPFAILPVEDKGLFTGCVGATAPESQEVVIENIPYEFAIPMLTGWNLFYGCDDEHVKEAGVWIDDWRYERSRGAPSGRLIYKLSSRLRDRGGAGHYLNHKVTILGIRRATGEVPFQEVPDLVPFSPLGTGMEAFCRFEQNGTQLRVTVKNQGNGDAPASKTTVLFPTFTLVRDTPPIPSGGQIDLVFTGTAACSFDCLFTIRVDSANQVNERTNEGNNSTNGRCIG